MKQTPSNFRKMFVLEFKVKAKTQQYQAIDDAIRTANSSVTNV